VLNGDSDAIVDTPESRALWTFSLRVYADPGVRRACLALQDQCGADVNLLLLILWLASESKTLTAEGFAILGAVSVAWQCPVLEPLRSLRRGMREELQHQNDPDRREILRRVIELELEAERREQRALALALGSCIQAASAEPSQAAADALLSYAKHLRARFPTADVTSLTGVLTASDLLPR
jgi:uncharacterized protein (TIGR02444 family)